MKKKIALGLALGMVFAVGCSPKVDKVDDMVPDTEIEQDVDVDVDVDVEEGNVEDETIYGGVEDEYTGDHIKMSIVKSDSNENVNYAVMSNMEEEIVEMNINKQIRDHIAMYEESEMYEDLKINSDISLSDDGIVSILLMGSYKDGEAVREFVRSLNFDLETSEEITFENYFKKDDETQAKLNEILNAKAVEEGLEGFEAEGTWIRFRNDEVIVFYYELDDSVKHPTELFLTFEEVKDLVK